MGETDRIWQEIHCPKSGGGCGGFILVKLNAALNYKAIVVCPKCKHEHTRCVQKGHVVESGRYTGSDKAKEFIRPTMAAWSAEPRTKTMVGVADRRNERDGVIITENTEFIKQPAVSTPVEIESLMMRELWEERHGGD